MKNTEDTLIFKIDTNEPVDMESLGLALTAL